MIGLKQGMSASVFFLPSLLVERRPILKEKVDSNSGNLPQTKGIYLYIYIYLQDENGSLICGKVTSIGKFVDVVT